MKVSLVKNLFSWNGRWQQKLDSEAAPELGLCAAAGLIRGKAAILWSAWCSARLWTVPLQKPATLEERSLWAGFLQDDVDAFRNHLDNVQVPSEVGSSGYSACILSLSRQGQTSQTLCRLSRTTSKQSTVRSNSQTHMYHVFTVFLEDIQLKNTQDKVRG